jgi:Amidohydrolase
MQRRQYLADSLTCSLSIMAATLWPQFAFAQNLADSNRKTMLAGWQKRTQGILQKGRLPIIDLQATFIKGQTNVPRMVELMDEWDVAQIAFAPARSQDGSHSLELYREYPQHFIPTTSSGEFPRWWNDPMAFLQVAKKDLQSGNYFFMGEHEFRHYPSPEQVAAGLKERDVTVELDGPVGDALFALSAETGVAFQIHYEIEDRLFPALEAVLGRHPKAKVIWCHLAMIRYPDRATKYTPAYVEKLINQFSGLYFDLAVPNPRSVYKPSGARDSTLYSAEGKLDPKWKTILEKYPERFLIASDYRPPVAQAYPRMISDSRNLILQNLTEPVRHLLAYKNAWRLIAGEEWGTE